MEPNPWLSVPLDEYEGHMSSAEVGQLAALSELFRFALERCRPESVAVLGIAGGNGLEHIDPVLTRRTAGVDIHPQYLEAVRQRFAALPGLELHCHDIAQPGLHVAPAAMVHAALIFEHAGLGAALKNALGLVAPGGRLSVVLQLASESTEGVASTKFTAIQNLKQQFALIEPREFERLLEPKGFRLLEHKTRSLPAGKAFWLGLFGFG